jgi:saccharopine dehydrogenase-like NADP-dependent oxidoreductase
MKKILILGAGQSTPYLINYLLQEAAQNNWFVKVADRSLSLAQSRVKDHPRGLAVDIDIIDRTLRKTEISQSDIVVNFLPPKFQYDIAIECLEFGKHMITASYEDANVAALDKEARCKGVLILNEMGLDPGIDHMSALSIIHRIRRDGGYVNKFYSYGTGLPAPEVNSNPLRYCITWNPRNIVMSGEQGAHYMENSKVKILNHNNVFRRTWNVMIDGFGELEAYPNRDAMKYQKLFRVNRVKTMIRGTLRYPGWCETWSQIVKLGMTNESIEIHHLKNKTFAEFTEMFLPIHISGGSIEARVANYLNISPTGKIMENLKWLGLFSDNVINNGVVTAADVLISLLNEKLQLPDGERDVVILHHEIEAIYPGKEKKEKTISTMVEFGKPYEHTAIAKTVGLPSAIAVKLTLSGELPMFGCVQPVHAAIYEPVLNELKKHGIEFKEKTIQLK